MAISQAAAIVSVYGGEIAAVVVGTSANSLANGLGRIATGWLCDRLDVRQLLSLVPLTAVVAFVALPISGTPRIAIIVLAVAGAAYGSLARGIP